jgi:cytochrome c556
MKNVRWTALAVMAGMLAGIGLFSADALAQKTKGKTRPALTKQIMKGLVNPNCGDLKKLLDAESPNWDDIALKAALLNEAGYLLMDDNRCPDGEWAKATKAVREGTAEVLAATESKNAEEAKKGFAKLTGEGCKVCHTAHRK